MPTPHNQAKQGDFAKVVLMPGDPLRAKFLADHYLTDVVQVNSVRNMLAYTGYYKGKRVSVMGSGMGMPSVGIYSHELFTNYGVDKIIRIGTCGAYQPDVKVFDVILVQAASTNSSWFNQYGVNGNYASISDFDMLLDAYKIAKELNIPVHVGNVLSSDIFYNDTPEVWRKWAKMGILGVEMESFALFCNANYLGKKAMTILTASDSLITHEETTAEQRQNSFSQMMEIALEVAIRQED